MTRQRRLSSLWNRVDSGEIHQAPRKWQAWLNDTGSLTQKIEQAIGQKLEVQVLRDCRQNLNSDESRYFHLQTNRCRIREVLLCSNGTPLVMARSIIPTLSSSGSNQAILRLGTRPLGAVLFSKTRQRSKKKTLREIACLTKRSSLWQQCRQKHKKLPAPLWARRTLYKLKGRPLLVCEIFLPELLQNLTKEVTGLD
jgi:chorismate--pyruvate lyase